MCNEAKHIEPYSLPYVPDKYKTQEMSNEVMHARKSAFFLISDRFKNQEMCIKAVEINSWQLGNFKSQKNCDAVVGEDPYSLQFIPYWFVKLKEIRYDDFDNDDELITWYEGYKRCRTHKAKVKEELMPITWHHTRMRGWCMTEDKKKKRLRKCLLREGEVIR